MILHPDHHSSSRGQHSSQRAEGTTPRAAASKLTEDQLLLLQQQWSQKHPRIRSDARSTRSTRSSVSGVQYSRVFSSSRPVSSSCAGRSPTPLFETPVSTHPSFTAPKATTNGNTTAYRDLSFAGVASSAGIQQQQQEEVLVQPRLTVRRRTDADVGTDTTAVEADISPVGRLRNRHTGAGAAAAQTAFATTGRYGTYGGSPFLSSSTSSNYSSYAPYTPANSTANARLVRTVSMPGRCSTPSSSASLAGLKYACSSSSSSNRNGGNFGAFLCPEDSGGSSSSRGPKTPQSWTMGQLPAQVPISGLQPAFSGASAGSTALQPAFSAVSNRSPSAAPRGAFTGYSGSSSSSSSSIGSWTPASSASSGVRTPFTTNFSPAPKSRRGSNAGLPPLAAPVSGSYSTYSIAAAAAAGVGSQGAYAGGAPGTTDFPPSYSDSSSMLQGVYGSRISTSGSLTGMSMHNTQRFSNAGGSVCGDGRGYMTSVPEVPCTYPAAAAAAAGPMASAAAAAAAAIADGFVQQGGFPGSFLPPLETVLTGTSEYSEGCASPRSPPGCIVGLFRALAIRKTPAKPRSPRRKTNGQKTRLSRKTNGHTGEVNGQWEQGDVSRHEVVTVAPTTRLNSLSAAGATAAAAAAHAAVEQPVVSRQNDTEAVLYLQQQQTAMHNHHQQQQEQKQEESQPLGYNIAAVGRAAVAAAGVCEPAAAGSGAVKATTVLYNSSPRGIYRYSSPNAGSSHTYLPGGYSYSMGGGSYIPLSSSSSSSSSRRLSNPAATAAAAAAAAVAAMTSAPRAYHDLKPANRVQLMAKTLDLYSQQGLAGSTSAAAGPAGFSSRSYRIPSTPGSAQGHISFAASGFAAAAARGVSSGGFSTAGMTGAQYSSSRVRNAGSALNGSSGGSILTPALLQQQQQMASPAATAQPRIRRGSNAGSVVSMISDRTYAEVVSTPRSAACGTPRSFACGTPRSVACGTPRSVACGTPRSVAGSVSGSSRMGRRQLRAVSGKGQLAWQPLQRGGSGYLATQ